MKILPEKKNLYDAFSLKTVSGTSIASKFLNVLISKQGYDAKVSIHEVTMSHSDSDGNVRVHLDLYLDASEKDIRKLINQL